MNTENSIYYTLNDVGEFIWQELQAGNRPEQIAIKISDSYEIETELALSDIQALIQQLLQNGLLTENT